MLCHGFQGCNAWLVDTLASAYVCSNGQSLLMLPSKAGSCVWLPAVVYDGCECKTQVLATCSARDLGRPYKRIDRLFTGITEAAALR